jgi:hypothetical protein
MFLFSKIKFLRTTKALYITLLVPAFFPPAQQSFPMSRVPPPPLPTKATSSPSRLAALKGGGPEWSTLGSSHCSHLYIQMRHSVSLAFINYVPTGLSFPCGTLLQYIVHQWLIIIFFPG